MIALAAGKDIYDRFEDNVDGGAIAMHLDDDTVTESQAFLNQSWLHIEKNLFDLTINKNPSVTAPHPPCSVILII